MFTLLFCYVNIGILIYFIASLKRAEVKESMLTGFLLIFGWPYLLVVLFYQLSKNR